MKISIEKAMILAAGEGTRLRPLTLETPKPLLPVGDVPIVIRQLDWLKSHGVTTVAINLYHIGEKIEAELGDGSRFGMKIYYSNEEVLLGTAGGLKRMESLFDSTFFVVYGDILTDLNLSDMARMHRDKNAMATIALFRTQTPWEVGIVEIDGEGRLLSFTEKPPKGTEKSNLSNGGIYVLEPEVFRYIPGTGFYDFGFNVFPRLLEDKQRMYGYVLRQDDYLLDIGTIDKYRKANDDMKAGKVKTRVEKQSGLS